MSIIGIKSFTLALAAFCILAITAEGQDRSNRTSPARPTPTATPAPNEAVIISRADDFPADGTIVTIPDRGVDEIQPASERTVEALEARIKVLEAEQKGDPDAKQRRLLLNLDILTRAEQRVESLRKQLFEMIEKENSIQLRLDTIELDSRPEMIERSVATAGSLRPEQLREARARQLAAESANLQNLLLEVQKNKTNLESNIQKAEDLVERLRIKLERDIDAALDDGTGSDTDNQ
jgi:hypothetical protein